MLTPLAETLAINHKLCTRCGGTGHFSYNQKDGTVCYGCGGLGVQPKAPKGQKKVTATAKLDYCKVGDVIEVAKVLYTVTSITWRKWGETMGSNNQTVHITRMVDGTQMKTRRTIYRQDTRQNYVPTPEMVGTEYNEDEYPMVRY